MQAMEFPHGRVYLLICQDGQKAITLQSRDPKTYKGSRFVPSNPSFTDPNQFFLIEKVGQEADEFQLISGVSDMVWDEEGSEICAYKGKKNNDQLFCLVRAGPAAGYYYITTNKEQTKAVLMEGILRIGPTDPNNPAQVFQAVPVTTSQVLNETSIILNVASGKAIDIPKGTFEPGARLVQYQRHRRFNQRFQWVKSGAGFMLVSLLTGLALDIEGNSAELGTNVCQWKAAGQSNQIWIPEPVGGGQFRLKSALGNGVYLGVKSDDLDDGAKIVTCAANSVTNLWTFEGNQPK